MCRFCWVESGSPTDPGPTGARVVELIGQLYRLHPTGGPLHAELDDDNLDGEIITPMYVIPPYGLNPGYPDNYSPEVHAICDELAELMTAMTEDQRRAALAIHDGYLPKE